MLLSLLEAKRVKNKSKKKMTMRVKKTVMSLMKASLKLTQICLKARTKKRKPKTNRKKNRAQMILNLRMRRTRRLKSRKNGGLSEKQEMSRSS